ncbi:hypothetical protein CYFUS_003502 [Cystobacter fuscus]|uniref:Activator of Hsp90 ATPase homologue 1/2-like C-terminal domain-containing protein n=1 Tax=Cystobacter fuscus TaxID=43 RepID=A0A250J4G0_9BACT|nr:SRPBCC domain-containing protein [Cystobacter fuscus]ATB38076.1 hypothetical protein CYFUS_003502 [Cystobacter fuscus]
MTEPSARTRSTRVSRIIKAPREAIYRAFLEPEAVAAWLRPPDMLAHVHEFDPREGGRFRMSLTYKHPAASPRGKTSEDTDTYQGRFAQLLPYEKIVEIIEFESQDAAFAGEMRFTALLADTGEGTEVSLICEDIPPGIRLEDNELGSSLSLQNLAAFIE